MLRAAVSQRYRCPGIHHEPKALKILPYRGSQSRRIAASVVDNALADPCVIFNSFQPREYIHDAISGDRLIRPVTSEYSRFL